MRRWFWMGFLLTSSCRIDGGNGTNTGNAINGGMDVRFTRVTAKFNTDRIHSSATFLDGEPTFLFVVGLQGAIHPVPPWVDVTIAGKTWPVPVNGRGSFVARVDVRDQSTEIHEIKITVRAQTEAREDDSVSIPMPGEIQLLDDDFFQGDPRVEPVTPDDMNDFVYNVLQSQPPSVVFVVETGVAHLLEDPSAKVNLGEVDLAHTLCVFDLELPSVNRMVTQTRCRVGSGGGWL